MINIYVSEKSWWILDQSNAIVNEENKIEYLSQEINQ